MSLNNNEIQQSERTQTVELFFYEEIGLPKDMTLEMGLGGKSYRASFPVDTEKFTGHERTVTINYTLEVEGQKILVERAVISPLTIRIEARYANSNTKRIFDGGDMKLHR